MLSQMYKFISGNHWHKIIVVLIEFKRIDSVTDIWIVKRTFPWFLNMGVPSAENSRSVRGLGKGVSGKPYPRLCNARRPRLELGTFWSHAVRLYRLHEACPSFPSFLKHINIFFISHTCMYSWLAWYHNNNYKLVFFFMFWINSDESG